MCKYTKIEECDAKFVRKNHIIEKKMHKSYFSSLFFLNYQNELINGLKNRSFDNSCVQSQFTVEN